ncbi:EAL domain-containing protein [Sphingomonas antarctica]|uniref:putative bifunctional diguanylate cyclase/phosphodiesterase n=1 Tax=Sphingomonas antarctica TaxID=2040274 RepID=UPI0039EBB6E6
MPRFRSLQAKLAALYGALFAVAMIVIAVVAQGMVHTNAQRSVMNELTTSGTVYDRIWAMRERALGSTADVLSRDFGFRSAVASGEIPTIESAVMSLRQRAGVPEAAVVDQSGKVVGAHGALASAIAALPGALDGGRRDAVVTANGAVYRLVISPILAPNEIGWVVLAVKLDAAEMRALEKLSAVPLTATILRHERGHWIASDASLAPDPAIDALVEQSRGVRVPTTLNLSSGQAYALAKPLAGPRGQPEAALLLRYPTALALAPYRPIQLGIALAGLIGLILVVLGSGRLSRSIARPIAALQIAAQSLEEGARTEVLIESDDEIGRLADSFNRMSAGIVQREHRITHLAFHDSLTNLPNRTYFRQSLEQSLGRANRADDRIAVLCLDLDGFKGVNDTLGHPVGDALLLNIGDLLLKLAPEAMVARLGGDEFAIVLSEGFDEDRPRALAQAILDGLTEPMEASGHVVATGTSIGIAISPGDGRDPDTLLKNADLALYRAKQDGRGIFRFFEPSLDEAARRRRRLELDLRIALKAGQFSLDFQPIYDLKAERIGGFEALLRWHHPERGLIPPTEFIPVAEDTGMIITIGEWVMREACRAAADWPPHVRVAVNVSPLQFRNSGFKTVVLQALAYSNIAPQRLEVEITESVFLDGEDIVVSLLHQLREMGVRVALDDFGTGYSSLSYLRSFPFDKIKIDKSFVDSVASDPSAAAIVRAIVDLAAALNMETTAEGVEDEDQLARLRGQGCSSIQGFLFSRPVSCDQVATLLGTGNERMVA